MTLKQRLFLLQILALIPWILGIALLSYFSIPEVLFLGRKIKVTENIPNVFQLLQSLQNIRGTISRLNFEHDASRRKELMEYLEKEKKKVNTILQDIESLYQKEDAERYRRILEIKEKIKNIESKESKIKGLDIFWVYKNIIIEVQQLLELEGHYYHLYDDRDLTVRTLAQISLIEIPKISETIAVLRGLGATYLTKKQISLKEKKELIEYYNLARGYLGAIDWTIRNIKYPESIHVEFVKVSQQTAIFLKKAEEIALSNSLRFLKINPEGYFILGTNVQEALYQLYQSIFKEISSKLVLRKNKFIANSLLIFIGISLVFGSICLTFYLNYLYIVKRLKKIEEGTKSISQGDLSARIELDRKDEIGELANLLNLTLAELQNKIKEIHFLHFHDSLTGLPNRERLLFDLNKFKEPAIVLMDILHFKNLNIIYGFQCGDHILKSLAYHLNNKFPEKVYRIGPDEFALAFDLDKEILTPSSFCGLMKDFAQNLEDFEVSWEDEKIKLPTFVACNAIKEEPNKMLITTYTLLKETIEKGERFICNMMVFERLEALSREYIYWHRKIKEALSEDRIIPFYQPILNLSSGRVEKFEALVRLRDVDGTNHTPIKFLEVSQKTGYYLRITQRMVEKVITDFRELPYTVSINFLARDFEFKELRDLIKSITSPNKHLLIIEANKLILELVETEEIKHPEEIFNFFGELKQRGVKIAIDDFGIGFSNLKRLIDLKVDYIKIDASIIKALPQDEKAQILVKAITRFAKESAIKTTAEHVADETIFNMVKELGIDYAQGYFISPPVSFEELKSKNFFRDLSLARL
ncbi:MAG: EAL domain-containing protein [Caldimicrobium sp.]|nr:EAL domain-containing protein [Caldimicrobium sp.]